MRNACVLLGLVGATLTGALIAVVVAAEPVNIAGQVTAIAGPVTVTRAQESPQALKFRDTLYWRDVVDAHKDGIARALLAGKMTVTIRELSRLELREEQLREGTRYTVELLSGKVRATVARMLMRPDDQLEVRTRNAVTAVRGTDFIVQTASDRGAVETVVVTLSGVVEVSNPLAGTGRVERIGAYEAARVSGKRDPVRFQVNADKLQVFLDGLTPPRPLAVGHTVEATSRAVWAHSLKAFQRSDGQSNGLADVRPSLDPDDVQQVATLTIPETSAAVTAPPIEDEGNDLGSASDHRSSLGPGNARRAATPIIRGTSAAVTAPVIDNSVTPSGPGKNKK